VANGASASNSGLLLVPLMGGLLISSIIAGQIISRTGRYRRFPIAGMAVTALGLYLLSTLDTTSTRWESGCYMALLGAGIGMVMQILVMAVQNEAPVKDLGVATSTVTFFRAVGGSVGVALFGALFAHRVGEILGSSLPTGMTPTQIAALPPEAQAATAAAFADAITMVFLYSVPLVLLGFVVTWLLRDIPLRTQSGEALRVDATAPATEPAGELVVMPEPADVLDYDGIDVWDERVASGA
jgi:MFS family permease